MNSRQQQLCAALGTAYLLAGCGPTPQPSTQGGAGAAGPGGASGAPATAAAPAKKCQVWLEVGATDDPHLTTGLRVRITGPTQDGDYRIRPMLNPPGHVWLSKDYDAELDDPNGQIFYVAIDVQGAQPAEPTKQHDEINTHSYKITMEFENGCPSKARLSTTPHPSTSGTDHGGDAVLD